MKKAAFLGHFATVLSAVLIAARSIAAFGDPTFTFDITGPNTLELRDVIPTGGVSFSVPSQENGKTVESIANNAFSQCVATREISIPASVMTIAPLAFNRCVSLIKILVEEGSNSYTDRDGVLYDATGEILILCPAGRSGTFTIPSGVKAVAEGAFADCALLTKIIVPSSVSVIGANVFANCPQLSSLVIPQNFPGDVTTLGLPADCPVSRYQPGGLDDPALPPRWAVSFNANGGTGTMADQVFSSGSAAKLRANAFKRTSYTFAGWARSAAGAVVYQNGQSVVDLAAAGERVTLYAKWTGVPYKVVFHEANKGGKTVSQSLRYGTAKALRKNTFKKKGYVLMGWAVRKGGPVAYKDGQTVVNLASKSGAKVHLYARWAVRKYKVHFDANGGKKGKMADQTFVYGKAKSLRANAFKRTGYTFTGWARKRTGAVTYANKQVVSSLTTKGGRIMLYAKWRRNRYTIVFDANGGSGTMADQVVSYGQKKKLRELSFSPPSGATRVFIGWSTTRTGKIQYADGATVSNLSAKDGAVVRLYARWAVRNYKIHFDANGGTGTMADQSFVYGAAAKALSANKFTLEDRVFQGWASSPTAEKATYADRQPVCNLTKKGGVITLYAVWRKVGDPNVVLCLGDSITEGYRCSGLPYPSRLAGMSGKSVRNYGKGGKLASYGASIAEEALQRENPGIVCILFGANDAIHHVSPAVTKENLRKIIRLCRKYNAKPLIATPTPQIGSHERFNSGVKAIASQVRSLAHEENVTLVDLNSAFGSGSSYLNPADGLHLNDAGGNLMAREFYKAF